MNLSNTEGDSASGAAVSSAANTHLSGFWLIIARAVWLALVIPAWDSLLPASWCPISKC